MRSLSRSQQAQAAAAAKAARAARASGRPVHPRTRAGDANGASKLMDRTISGGAGSALCAEGNPSHAPSANSSENGSSSFSAAIRQSQRRTTAALPRVSVEKIHATPQQQHDCHR